MPDIQKITVLLADGDALRRDGLAAVLKANADIDIVAECSDGLSALDTIRDIQPEVAVVDLNLTGLHGIELVRRVRGENPGTKVVILSGTAEDEIVREVVRAGADGYLLKNGPSRHLIDAIHYVRDGGQYFSPQLGRDGRDRHLLEEPPRVPVDRETDDEGRAEHRRLERRGTLRGASSASFRERIREEAHGNLRDRDYEIMSEMADGIRPILDRLDEIEGRVVEMESGEEPVPADPRGWLNEELTDTLSDSRAWGSRRTKGAGLSARDMEARLPQMIEEAVTKRFQTMAGKLQEQIEEQHVRTLETFVKNIQVKLVQRVSALEQNMSQQAEAMHELREYNQRTEDNLSRLISGVDKLATDLPKRLAAAKAENPESADTASEVSGGREKKEEKRRSKSSVLSRQKNLGPKIFWAVVLLVLLGLGINQIHSKFGGSDADVATTGGAEGQSGSDKAPKAARASGRTVALPDSADSKTKLEAAKMAMDRKEYTEAEDIYKQVVQAEPKNEEALKGLASVLYRENKLDESAEVLERLPKN